MDHLVKKSILDLPDEVIEIIMIFLSFDDLFNLSKIRKKLADCAKHVSKKKPFGKYDILQLKVNYIITITSFVYFYFCC